MTDPCEGELESLPTHRAAWRKAPFAQGTQAVIDAEVQKLLRDAEKRAVAVLTEHRDVYDRLVDMLLDKETVDGSEIYRLTGLAKPSEGQGRTIAPDRALAKQASAPTAHPGG